MCLNSWVCPGNDQKPISPHATCLEALGPGDNIVIALPHRLGFYMSHI